MSDLYSNYYVCTKCGQPCDTKAATGVMGALIDLLTDPLPAPEEPNIQAGIASACCDNPVVVKSTPYIVGTPLQRRPEEQA